MGRGAPAAAPSRARTAHRQGPDRGHTRGLSALCAALLFAVVAAVLPGCGGDEVLGNTVLDNTVLGSAEDSSDCTPVDSPHSVARQWNEVALDAIRRDFPAPTVHARNLFHLSAVTWDAWTAYDDPGRGWFVDEQLTIDDDLRDAARVEAISYASYRLLRHRYALSMRGLESVNDFHALMAALCYPTDVTTTEGNSPAALGNRIAMITIDATIDDGSNESRGYAADYAAVNEPLPVADSGTTMADPNRWQPLAFVMATSQNGFDLPPGAQVYSGPQWGAVTPFALGTEADSAATSDELPLDPGPPPLLGDPESDAEFREGVVDVIRASATLDATADAQTADGVPLGDWGRVVAEFWADGPSSETPPGHWNALANEASDHPAMQHRLGGVGPILDRLEWDVRLYFALNGALHDAAIAAWGTKRVYDYSRPISMIRHLGGLGDVPDGLPLEDGLIEVITSESSANGERHDHLAEHVGEIAIRSWVGQTPNSEQLAGGVDWIRAVDWMPYQRSTFVTPAFPGYVSGHSTFSRAAAELLTAFTGDANFPGGGASHTVPAGELEFEAGPSTDVTLQWVTYRDAADEAGLSRIYGGIHVPADDFPGRLMGARCGELAWALAQQVWSG